MVRFKFPEIAVQSTSEIIERMVECPHRLIFGDVPGSVEFLKRSALPTLSR